METRNVETSAAVERESTTHTASATHTKALTTTHSKAATTTHTASATHSKSVTAADTVSTTHSAAVSTAAVSTAAVSTATVSAATVSTTAAAAGRCNSWGKSDRCTDCGGGGNGDERFSKHGSVSSLERTSATTAILAPAADGGLNA